MLKIFFCKESIDNQNPMASLPFGNKSFGFGFGFVYQFVNQNIVDRAIRKDGIENKTSRTHCTMNRRAIFDMLKQNQQIQLAHNVKTTLYGRCNDIKILKKRRNNVVLTSCARCGRLIIICSYVTLTWSTVSGFRSAPVLCNQVEVIFYFLYPKPAIITACNNNEIIDR